MPAASATVQQRKRSLPGTVRKLPKRAAPVITPRRRHSGTAGHGKLTRAPKSFAHDLGRVTGREPAKSPQDEFIARLGVPIGVV
jgi:hypothetical protein